MKQPMATTAKVLLVVAIILVVAVGGVLLRIYVPRWTAPPLGKTEEITIVNQGAYRIQGYEKFYDLQEELQSVGVRLEGYPESPEGRDQTECRGLLARRAEIVAAYNAASRAERTTGQWRAADLPELLVQENPRTCN